MKIIWIPVWKQAPFIRLVIPFIVGIIVQWYWSLTWEFLITIACCLLISLLAFRNFPLSFKFRIQPLQGLIISFILFTSGMMMTYQKDYRHRNDWIGHKYQPDDEVIVYLAEPPVQKTKSIKVLAQCENIIRDRKQIEVFGKLLLYLRKDSASVALKYGDRIIFHKTLLRIRNAGNPGEFDYAGYCALKGISHTAFLQDHEWVLAGRKKVDPLHAFLYKTREQIIAHLQRHINHDDQLYLAEALLIGYTDDLDHDLVKAYSNTGVVHIIAISGMHLGLIYIILLSVFNKIPVLKRSKILKTAFLLSGIWLFALLTGGCPSILRSAVMFSCIIIGLPFSRRPSIHNSLALSAFILLCYDPYYLWDVGFQLSYLSLYGIVIFQKYITGLAEFKHKWMHKIWEPCAVSIAAQVLTFPVCLYYFHQFPIYFLFTNMIAVPLSTLILFVEILLVTVGWIPLAGHYIGKITWFLILIMNKVILFFDHLPFSVIEDINISLQGSIMLYLIVLSLGYFLLCKYKYSLWLALVIGMIYCGTLISSSWKTVHQKKIIVYNIPNRQAIDLIDGPLYAFIGDSSMLQDRMQQYNLKPCRLTFHASGTFIPYSHDHYYLFYNKIIVLLDSNTLLYAGQSTIHADLIIMSKNTAYSIESVLAIFNCRNFVFDASNSMWKIRQWERECELLHLPNHNVSKKGAYIMNL